MSKAIRIVQSLQQQENPTPEASDLHWLNQLPDPFVHNPTILIFKGTSATQLICRINNSEGEIVTAVEELLEDGWYLYQDDFAKACSNDRFEYFCNYIDGAWRFIAWASVETTEACNE